MERFWMSLFLTLTCFHSSDTFILPLKNTDGNLDVEHVIGHMTLLEQKVTGFEQTIRNQDTDITLLKNEISNLKANQQTINNHHADIASMKTEIVNLKTNQQKLDTRIADLQKQGQSGQVSAEVTSLKSEVNAAKSEVTQVSNKVTSLTSKFNNLGLDYETLSRQVMTNQNMTKTLQATQGTVFGQVQSSVNRLNKAVSALSHNSTVAMTDLSAKIAQLTTEVGFNVWLGSYNVNLQPSTETTLKFQHIQYNNGGGYSTTTGVFTAQVSGTYLFFTQVRKRMGSSLYLYLTKGSTRLAYFYIPVIGDVSGSLIAVAAVGAGEQVYVSAYGASSVYCCYNSRFGGALLYRH